VSTPASDALVLDSAVSSTARACPVSARVSSAVSERRARITHAPRATPSNLASPSLPTVAVRAPPGSSTVTSAPRALRSPYAAGYSTRTRNALSAVVSLDPSPHADKSAHSAARWIATRRFMAAIITQAGCICNRDAIVARA